MILVFDALSQRDMSLYGCPRQTTPQIEKFAAQSTIYHRHYAAGSFTTPGTASLLTGVQPWTHRAIHLQGQTVREFGDNNIFSLMPKSYHKFSYTQNTLAYILLDQFSDHIDDLIEISSLAEYSDLLVDKLPLNEFNIPLESELLSLKNFYSDESSLFLSLIDQKHRQNQTRRLNDKHSADYPRGLTNCRMDDPSNSVCFTLEKGVDWLIEQIQSRPQPYLGYIHFFPPHAPYNPRQEFINRFTSQPFSPKKPEHHFSEGKNQKNLERQRLSYDETIAYVDSEFGRIADALKSANLLENTCLVVTSDHGELFERGISGHNTPVLYEPLLEIPLLIAFPGQKTRLDIHVPTHAVDVLPTLLQLAGEKIPDHLQGFRLPTSAQEPISERDLLFCDAKSNPKTAPLKKASFSLLHDPYKLIYYRGYGDFDEIFELYDLVNDPEEMINLYSSDDPISNELSERLRQQIAAL